MKFILEIILMLIPGVLFVGGLLFSTHDFKVGIVSIFLSFIIWSITAELEDNKKDSIPRKLIRGLSIPVLLFILMFLFGIAAYYQEVAYIKYGMLGYLIVGPLGIVLIVFLLKMISEKLNSD